MTVLLVVSAHAMAVGNSQRQALPVKDGRPVVAVVGNAPIFLSEFLTAQGDSANRAELQQGRGTADDLALLDRLVAIKLIVQEATTMGLDEAPEIQKQVDVQSREILRAVLTERLVKDVKPDPAVVLKLFRDSVREWKTASLLFLNDADAQRVQKELAAGAAFADVAAREVAAKTTKASNDDASHPRSDYLPQIAAALATLKVGQVSPVIPLQTGFVVVKLTDISYPENAEARAEATKQSLGEKRVAFMNDHGKSLRRQYVVVNQKLLDSLDYETAGSSLDALLKDTRVVVEIKGAESVTVGDLTDYLRMQFFHGSDDAAQRRVMNARKQQALDATISRRLLNMEALKTGIDKTNEYRDRVTGYRESLVFDTFVQKVIAPTNKMREDETLQYYISHLKDYSYPGMMRVRSIAFAGRNAAEDAMQKLRAGTDFSWLAANAEGQVAEGTTGVLVFDGKPVTVDSMPVGMQKALAGAKAGEPRLYGSPEGRFYVLQVQQVVESTAQPYDEVREKVAQKLYGEKIQKAVEDYAAKLRTQVKVETYLVRARG